MKNTKNIIRHGEVILYPITELPKGAKLEKESKEIIVAHSETGHHHVLSTLDMSKIKVYTLKGDTYLEVPQIAELWHQKSGKDVHTPHKVTPSIYKINIKKQFDYFKGALESVRD